MARLIDADELIYGLKTEFGQFAMKYILAFIKVQPTVDPVKHGHWILDENEKIPCYQIKTCSLCGCRVNGTQFNFCPRCGARMDGDQNGI